MKQLTIIACLLAIGLTFMGAVKSDTVLQNRTDDTIATLEVDEFESFEQYSANDEFESFEQAGDKDCGASCGGCTPKKSNAQLWWVLSALGATVLSGFLLRYKSTRNLRGAMLLLSLLIFGFYVGACPCPIMSLHNIVFALAGIETNWTGMLWLLGLIPVTYIFGKVWCGWVCHLGALQEFIFLPGKIKILQSQKAQTIMRWIRIFLLITLVLQILITQTNLFKTIDPFKVAFNLRASNLTGWILLGLLLVMSLFMYRPFCKAVCPIGLLLGWVAKIPGASILVPSNNCSGCKVCNRSCEINAITCDDKLSVLDNQECIACGNCVGDCKNGSMKFTRNTKNNASKSVCKRN